MAVICTFSSKKVKKQFPVFPVPKSGGLDKLYSNFISDVVKAEAPSSDQENRDVK